MPTVLRAAVIDEGEVEGKVYYIRNVATGLYLKYGGTWGTHAVEGRAAHPFALESWGNDVFALNSVMGYLSTRYSGQSDVDGFPMDAAKADSKWKLVRVNNTQDHYYIEFNGRRLASQSHVSGQVHMASPDLDVDDNRQKWQLLTKDEILPAEIKVAQNGEPISVDVTALIKESSFDMAGYFSPANTSPLYSSLGMSAATEYRNFAWKATSGETAENGVWSRLSWWDVLRDADPMVHNGAFVTRNDVHSAFTVSQEIDVKLPAGNYTFSFEGFYARRHSGNVNETMNVTMTIKGGAETKSQTFTRNTAITNSEFISGAETMTYNGVKYYKDQYSATLFKDNDQYLMTIPFTIPQGGSKITIEISKPETQKYAILDGHIGLQTWQNIIACDNLTLTYHGNPVGTTDTDPSILYYDRVRAAYLHATAKLYKLAGNSYADACAAVSGCVHWTKWDAAISGVVRVEGITDVRGQNPTDPNPAKKFAYLNGDNKIDTEKEFLEALAKIEEAYQAALEEHNSHKTDFTGKILNHSFEMGDLTYWSVEHTDGDIAVWPNSNGTYTTAGVDGDYLFNSYLWPDENTNAAGIMQEITDLDNGLYKLEALVTAFGPGERSFIPAEGPGNTVFVFANGYHVGVEAKTFTKFEEATLYFLVENGKATIGAVGGNNGTRLGVYPFKYYYPRVGCFFKADNFRLTYICDVPNGKLRLALDEAQKANIEFDEFGKASIAETLTQYESVYDQKTATTSNVDGYVTDIHTALNTAAKAQRTIDADMTYAVKNPNFEWSWVDGEWSHTPGEDSGIRMQEHLDWMGNYQYRTVGVDGRYLFNTWKNNTKTLSVVGCKQNQWWSSQTYTVDVNYESAEPLTQRLTDLPNGTYKLEAMLVSHTGETVVLTANGVSAERDITYAKENGEIVSVECEVTDGTLDIQVAGKQVTKTVTIPYYKNQNYKAVSATSEQSYSYTPWFKADNFRLTLLKPQLLILDEKATVTPKIEEQQYDKVRVMRTVKSNSNWSTFVLPFEVDLTADNWLNTSGCLVKELKSVDVDGEHVRLTFGNPQTSIEAGRPCIIKNPSANELKYIEVENVNVDTRYDDEEAQTVYYEDENGLMRFHGVYHRRAIPQGAFFISSNNFYKAVGPKHPKPDMISGFRGYFELTAEAEEQGVRAFSFRIGEDETAIEDVNNEPATVVAIYNLNGMRLDDMQEGVNILQMSDGTSIKVVIE